MKRNQIPNDLNTNIHKRHEGQHEAAIRVCEGGIDACSKNDIDQRERVQRAATRWELVLMDMSYDVELQKIGLNTLEEKRKRGRA